LSSASLATVRSQGPDGHTSDESRAAGSVLPSEQKVRKRTVSRVSARELPTTASSGSYPPLSGTGLVTKATRPRAHSIASSISAKGAVSTATLWQSYTQKTLEKVLQSRLVETFITVTVPSSLIKSAPLTKHPTPTPHSSPVSHARQPSSNASPASKRGLHSPRDSPSRSPSSSREERLAKRVSRTGTATPTDNPTPPSSNRRVAASPTKHASKAAEPASRVDPETWTVPNFISAIHRPSTNPDFALDLNDFSKWSDPLATRITVQLWAKLRPDTTGIVGGDKGKEKMSDGMATVHPQWKMAGSWDICLSDLVPLPDEVGSP
jgi:UV radiation resistance-associated gene protein